MSNMELTIDEAIQRLKESENLKCTRYHIKEIAPNTLYDIIYTELYDGEVGEILCITYTERGRTSTHTYIKMKESRWEDEGNLYNRKKGCMYGSYSSENETYKSLKYVLDNYDCRSLDVMY